MEEFRGPNRSIRMMHDVKTTAERRWPPPQVTPMAADSQFVVPLVRPWVCWISRPSSSLYSFPFQIRAPAKKPIPEDGNPSKDMCKEEGGFSRDSCNPGACMRKATSVESAVGELAGSTHPGLLSAYP